MAKRKPFKYPGDLGKRFPPLEGGDDPASEKHLNRAFDRLMMLFDFFEVERPKVNPFSSHDDPETRSWRTLAIALAHFHVPGLQTRQRGGAHRRWNDRVLTKLCLDVEVRKRQGQTIRQACMNLARQDHWRSRIGVGTAHTPSDDRARGETLRRRAMEAKRTKHRAFQLIKQIEERWPDRAEDYLRIAAERYR